MSEKLLPCPFCGHDTPEFERMGDRRQSCIVICGWCGARHESSDEGDRCGSSWNQRAKATPSAPTAVEPDERAEFEAWAGPITALAKENGKYVEVMTSLAWEAWQARASKGTP